MFQATLTRVTRPGGERPFAAPAALSASSAARAIAGRWQAGRSMTELQRAEVLEGGPPAWAMALPWVLCGLISASQAYFLWPPADRAPSFLYDLTWQLPPWLFLAAAAPLVARMARRFPLAQGRWGRSLGPHLLANAALAAGHVGVAVATGYLLGEAFFRENSPGFAFVRMLAKGVQTELFIYWLIVALVHAHDYQRKVRAAALVSARLETALAQAELEALKMQLHPHFLFNTLHAIGVLVRKQDTPGALGIVVGGRWADTRGRRAAIVPGLIGVGVFNAVFFSVSGPPMWAASLLGSMVGALCTVKPRPRSSSTSRVRASGRMSISSPPVSPSVCQLSPGMNCNGNTPMPTRLERWIRSKLSAITALTPSRLVPLAAQSRLEPVPYSWPAITTSGVPEAWYCMAAS